MKELGGYLPLELSVHSEYFNDEDYDLLRLNCGRTAIITAIKDGQFSKVYLPLYLCESVGKALDREGISYSLYNISGDFLPVNMNIKEDEAIVIVNYFGIIPEIKMESFVKRYKNVIFDNTQAFFNKPICEAYNVYSCRKFFGVCDGAYLIKQHLDKINYPIDSSGNRSIYLLNSIENGTNFNYADSLKNEEYLCNVPMMQMSRLTRKILMSINYDIVKKVRKENFNYLHDKLSLYNELDDTTFFQTSSPMIYPFMFSKKNIREKLVKEKRIYISQFWKWVISDSYANDFERNVSKNIYALPIDQRYGREEMDYLANIILNLIRE